MDAYEKIKKVLALGFMNFLDENRPKDKMCLSNGECADIEKAFNEKDWPKLARYLDKYTESENERIRKALIDTLKVSETIGELKFRLPYPTREECIAYLEKQKEQKPNYCHHEVDETGWTEEYRKAYYDGWDNCNMQHEQLKADHKPAEWSEEDENMWTHLNGYLNGFSCSKDAIKQMADWFYELPNRFYLQQKQEWSEEDERMRNGLISLIEEIKLRPLKRMEDWDGYLHFLKSLRPSWKPSEEQMRTLYCVAYGIPNPDGIILMSLWNDLKKQK